MLGTDKVQEFDILLERNVSEYSALIGLEKITARDAGNLYVMAYAENTEGRAYGLEERINITPRALEQDDWTGARALENREGWWNSPWFGTLLPLGGIRLVVAFRTWVDVSSTRTTQWIVAMEREPELVVDR